MREVVISRWCEVCWQEDQTKTPAIGAVWLTLTLSEDSVLPPAKAIDICEDHGPAFADMATLYEAAAAPAEGPRPVAASNGHRGPGRPPSAPPSRPGGSHYTRGHWACPICDAVYTAKYVLQAHIWDRHRPDDRPPTPTSCPDCGLFIASAPGMGNHRNTTHGYDGLTDTLSGVPGWNKTKAERWRKGLTVE